MNPITQEATSSTPYIRFEPRENRLEMKGESYPENALSFYEPLIEAIEAHLKTGRSPLEISLALSYMNTSSIKALMDILDLADEAHKEGAAIEVIWYHDPEDDRSLEVAEEFCEDLSLPFKTISKRFDDA
jgi:hypothetical protein